MAEREPTPSKSEKSTSPAEEERTEVPDLESGSGSIQHPSSETGESSAVPEAEAVPGSSTSFFATLTSNIQVRFRRFTKKKSKGEKWWSRGKKQKISKAEYARQHGGFLHSDMEGYFEEESSGIATESSVVEESSVAQSPLEKEFPDKPDLKDDPSDEDAPPMEQ
ncbi:uncharacterized protein [Parasteatoda tepidariorum]|uniref:uncharacterized protein n=1 Tax=Parasteatoda tepidariorum TaxID=114398 RepID=UPI00077FA6CF|nr:uncharacterized protein LOC107452334 [Parasteatoda tepidariorum]